MQDWKMKANRRKYFKVKIVKCNGFGINFGDIFVLIVVNSGRVKGCLSDL